jgi:hypothetical protein
MISIKQYAAKLGISAERLRALCREGRIEGAKLVGGVWVLPARAKVTAAARTRPGKLRMKKAPGTKRGGKPAAGKL